MNVSRQRFGRLALALGLVLLLAGRAQAADQISPEAKLHFRNGVELIQGDSPNYQDAYYQFKLAYDKSQSWKVLGNLGLCAMKLERDGEAREYYTKYLVGGGKSIDAEERGAIERELLFIEGNSARVTLTSSEANIQVVDARSGTSAPPQSYTFSGTELSLMLRAGTHTLTATSQSGKRLVWETNLTPGATLGHTFDFDAPPEAPPVVGEPSTTPPPPPPPRSTSGSGASVLSTVGFVATGVGGAALVGGLITGILAQSKQSDVDQRCPNKECPPGVDREEVEADLDEADSLARVTNVLLIGGGVLAAGGITMIIIGSSSGGDEEPQTGLSISPVFGAGSAGVFAHGTF